MGKKILVVEDERNIVDILTFNLGREGYDTLEALDGAEGLRLALAEDPDLILLDLMLPKMDGFEVCRRLRELLARVKSNIRRTDMLTRPASAGGSRMELGRVQVDLDAMVVYKDGEPLELTQREYELVKALASARGQAVSRESLMKQVWNFDGYVGDVRAVDVAIRRLREKLEDDPADPKFIVTRRGLGYAFGL